MELLGTRDVYGEVLLELGRKNRNIVALDADLSGSTMTKLFAKEFPERFFNIGVAEQDMTGTAAGLALAGKIPFVSSFAIFASGRAWEQVRQAIAYPRLNVKIVASHGGICVGEDGASHQTVEDLGLMRIIPNMTVIVPADGVEMRSIMQTAVETAGPFFIRTSRMKFPVIYSNGASFRIGKGDVVREGKDLTVIALGLMVSEAKAAAEVLARKGISARVVNMSCLKPIDRELIAGCARETGAVVTAEEHSVIGGLGSAVAEILSETYPVPVRMVGVKDRFGTSGTAPELLDYYGLTSRDIVSAAEEVLARKG
ncbi:MAG: transketolase family protein [Syntrophales bacterium]|nr:transketolase family protein [Syntrophales bacterium]MDD5233527.1 transketolase family protein [Syntrophales bacterium]MDD5533014.1 transketolase family protein [Syntrophales bacterium]